ncbi:ATP-binding protein [Prochlorothrix hollandica]|uniref:ATP-binding protein n=1 Tax=Prochlorothrix hollandica TaxID=1223 RepID=UPI000347600B|nr:ATP-binding protein [Prochlorothrix hollandica]
MVPPNSLSSLPTLNPSPPGSPVTPIIGTVKGPGEDGNQYLFITTENRQVRIGEFVYYQWQEPSRNGSAPFQRQILGKISGRRLTEHFPDRIFADTETSPEVIAALVGFTYANPELYEVTVDVMGYFDPNLGFINPRRAPDPGAKVYWAGDQQLQGILNKKTVASVGSAEVGYLLLREPGAVPVVLDVKELVSTHMAILAGTGSGKSYTAGVLIEEMMRPYNRAAVLIFDPHGEYGTLSELRGHPAFRGDDGYQPQVKILAPKDIRIRISSLDYYDVLTLLPNMSDRQQSILNKAFALIYKHRKGDFQWDVHDLIAAVHEADTQVDEEGNEKSGSSAPALEWKLDRLARSDYFHPSLHLTPPDLLQPGQVTVLQMNQISQEEQQVICAALLRQVYQARMNTATGILTPDSENYLPYPIFTLIEEAHRFAAAHEPSRCKQILRTILSEGRKFGLGVGLITQRPGKLDSDVLSQCMSQFLMRIVNPVDQDSLKHGVEAAGRDLLQELPSLTKGQVIVAGACVNTPVLCQIRQRLTKHGGNTLDAPDLWQQHFQAHRVQEREIKQAPLAPRPRGTSRKGRSIE